MTTSPMTSALVNPSVLSTAISVRLSRTVMLMVFAVTSRIAKHTVSPMPSMSTPRSPAMDMKSAVKAFSLSVMVGELEFSNSASTALPISAARAGSSISTRKVMARIRFSRPSSRYLKWKTIISVSVPG